jgi:hypothetical protein
MWPTDWTDPASAGKFSLILKVKDRWCLFWFVTVEKVETTEPWPIGHRDIKSDCDIQKPLFLTIDPKRVIENAIINIRYYLSLGNGYRISQDTTWIGDCARCDN